MPTIIDIHQELLAPYGELRLDGGVLTEEEVFLLLHNETSESLKVQFVVWVYYCCMVLLFRYQAVAWFRLYPTASFRGAAGVGGRGDL